MTVGLVHKHARHYDEAITIFKKVATEEPTFADVHQLAAGAYWGKRMYPQGFRAGGWHGALTKGTEVRQGQRKNGYGSAYDIALLYADLGSKDEAFKWLDTAYRERDFNLIGLETDFLLDPIRSDTRFAELVRKVGLPQ